MNRVLVLLSLMLLVGSTAEAQDGVSHKQTTAAEVQHQGGTTSENAKLTSPLCGLEWMVGCCVDGGDDAIITTQCSWAQKESERPQADSPSVKGVE